MLYSSLFFVFFSGNSIFSIPIFLFFFSLSFLIHYEEITELKIPNINKPGSRFIKESFDYILAVTLFIVLLPVLLLLAVIILINMGWPFLYTQQRIGKNGKIFRIYKFRTMNKIKPEVSVSASEFERISKLGHFLRKNKIDELPELMNIIRGDMSFVGTRPDVPGYADKLKGDDRIILCLKPGLTGAASLKYVNEEELLSKVEDPIKYNDEVIFPNKVKINKAYMKNWSFWLDIKIIIYTLLRKQFEEEFLK
ncbi:MAG: sugar transferase [Bacteroidales bacterium]|nr:sugar transferase [Bacteroidales bacterium]